MGKPFPIHQLDGIDVNSSKESMSAHVTGIQISL